MDGLIIAILLLQSILSALFAALLATEKGHPWLTWFLLGLFFGTFGFLASIGLPDNRKLDESLNELDKTCPDCFETVHKLAKKCKFCGFRFPADQMINTLRQYIPDLQGYYKYMAIKMLCDYRDQNTISFLIDIYQSTFTTVKEYSSSIRDVILEVFQEMQDLKITEAITSRLGRDTSSKARKSLIELLGQLKDHRSTPLLIYALVNRQLRDTAMTAIENIGEPAIPYLKQALPKAEPKEKKMLEALLQRCRLGKDYLTVR